MFGYLNLSSLVVKQVGWLDGLGTRLPTPQGGQGFGLSSSCLDEFTEGMRPSVMFDRLQLPAIHTLGSVPWIPSPEGMEGVDGNGVPDLLLMIGYSGIN